MYFPCGRIRVQNRLAVEAVRPCAGAPLPLPLLGQPRTGPSQLWLRAEQWKAPGLFPDYAPPVRRVHMEVPLSSYGAASLPCTHEPVEPLWPGSTVWFRLLGSWKERREDRVECPLCTRTPGSLVTPQDYLPPVQSSRCEFFRSSCSEEGSGRSLLD